MKLLAGFLLGFGCILSSPKVAVADPCGQPPPTNQTFSSNFQKAVLKIYDSNSSDQSSASLQAIAEGVFATFGFSASQQDVINARDQITLSDAENYVQQEYKNQQAQIVAECGYRMCYISSQPGGTLAAEGLANVCAVALKVSGSAPSTINGVVAQPSIIPIVFQSGQDTLPYTGVIEYLGAGKVHLLKPQNTAYVAVKIPQHGVFGIFNPSPDEVTLGHDQSVQIDFVLKKPPIDVCTASDTLPFTDKDDASASATFTFQLIHDASCTQPAQTVCGQINPNISVTAYSDVDPSQAFPPQTSGQNSWTNFPPGETVSFSHYSEGYPHNGGGSMDGNIDISCSINTQTPYALNQTIQINSQLRGESGYCCGGWGQGGSGMISPAWVTTISLPGDPITDIWNINILTSVSTNFPQRSCQIEVDGSITAIGLSNNVSNNFSLSPGSHQIQALCRSPNEFSTRPGSWSTWGQVNESITLAINGSRPMVTDRSIASAN